MRKFCYQQTLRFFFCNEYEQCWNKNMICNTDTGRCIYPHNKKSPTKNPIVDLKTISPINS